MILRNVRASYTKRLHHTDKPTLTLPLALPLARSGSGAGDGSGPSGGDGPAADPATMKPFSDGEPGLPSSSERELTGRIPRSGGVSYMATNGTTTYWISG
jgi:hypothetical protein